MSMPRPSTARRPLAPLPATSSMSRDIGLFSLTIEPTMCTLAAVAAAALAAATTWSGDFEERPLPDELEPPQPLNSATPIRGARSARTMGADREGMCARTLARGAVGPFHLLIGTRR